MTIEAVATVVTVVFLACVWLVARRPGPTPPPRPSSLTPAEQEKMRQIGADVGSGLVKGSDHDYWSKALRPSTDGAASRSRRER
jgi:hypothetical protein